MSASYSPKEKIIPSKLLGHLQQKKLTIVDVETKQILNIFMSIQYCT